MGKMTSAMSLGDTVVQSQSCHPLPVDYWQRCSFSDLGGFARTVVEEHHRESLLVLHP